MTDVVLLQRILQRGAVNAAQALLGWELYNEVDGQQIGGRIIETEAYTEEDPASHTYRGRTIRNAPMFEEAGRLYIYFTYGMHWCMNIVTGPKGYGEAVLLRGLEPLHGLDIMQQKRRTTAINNLCSGPAKLVQALGIDPAWTGQRLQDTPLILKPGKRPKNIVVSHRIGITEGQERLWRFSEKA